MKEKGGRHVSLETPMDTESSISFGPHGSAWAQEQKNLARTRALRVHINDVFPRPIFIEKAIDVIVAYFPYLICRHAQYKLA